MSADIYAGKLVRLAPMELEADSKLMAGWARNSEYSRLLDSDPAMLWAPKQMEEWFSKGEEEMVHFMIHTLADDRTIGMIDLSGFNWIAGHCWVGIGLGEPEFWGKGHGSDAMNVILRFGFCQLNLNRVNLNVFEYNPRAFRSYEKVGFQVEGRERQWMAREGKRWDIIYMGILRREWEALQPPGE
jgi:RimJ/RimL family protein N-acetyltransferase